MSQKVKPLQLMENVRKTEKEKKVHSERIVAICSELLIKWILFLTCVSSPNSKFLSLGCS